MWNSILFITLLLANYQQADSALVIEISHMQTSNGASLLNIVITNKSNKSFILPNFNMFNDSVFCFDPYWQINIKKDGITYYVPSILCHPEKFKKTRIKKQSELKLQVPLHLKKISSNGYDFSKTNHDFGEYEISLKVKPLNSKTEYLSNFIRINYIKII
ncbi:MAG: hypothetical protein ACUVT3_09420 [Ignavibacterium sp.]